MRVWAEAWVCMYETRLHDFSHEPHVMRDAVCLCASMSLHVCSSVVLWERTRALVCVKRPSVGQAHRTHCLFLARLASHLQWLDHIKPPSTYGVETSRRQEETGNEKKTAPEANKKKLMSMKPSWNTKIVFCLSVIPHQLKHLYRCGVLNEGMSLCYCVCSQRERERGPVRGNS